MSGRETSKSPITKVHQLTATPLWQPKLLLCPFWGKPWIQSPHIHLPKITAKHVLCLEHDVSRVLSSVNSLTLVSPHPSANGFCTLTYQSQVVRIWPHTSSQLSNSSVLALLGAVCCVLTYYNTTTVKKAQQRLHFLRILMKKHLEKRLMVYFYCSAIKSVLVNCFSTWYASCSADRKALQGVINTAQKMCTAFFKGHFHLPLHYQDCQHSQTLLSPQKSSIYSAALWHAP